MNAIIVRHNIGLGDALQFTSVPYTCAIGLITLVAFAVLLLLIRSIGTHLRYETKFALGRFIVCTFIVYLTGGLVRLLIKSRSE